MATAPVSSPPLLSPQAEAPRSLQSRLNALTRRRNAVVVTRSVLRALVPGVWLSALGIALYKTHLIPDAPLWTPLAILGVCGAWGLRNGLARRDGAFRAALDADVTLGLKDSLGSALSFVAPDAVGSRRAAPAPKTFSDKMKRAVSGRSQTFHVAPQSPVTPLVPALVFDAAARAQALDPRRVYGWKFDRTAKVLAVGVVLLLGSLFVPDRPLFASKKELADRANVMKAGEQLAMLSKQIEKRAPKDSQVAELNKKLQTLGLKMARGRMTKRAALTSIGELKQQLQKAQPQPPRNENAANQGGMPQIPEAIKQAPMQSQTGQKVQQDLQNNKFEEAARELDRLADKLEKGQLSPQEKEKAAKDLEEVARGLRQRGGQANENAAQQLEQAAKQLRQPSAGQQNPNQGQQGQNDQQSPNGSQKNGNEGGQKQSGSQNQGQQGQGQQGQSPQKQGGQQNQGQQGQGKQGGAQKGQNPSQGSQGQGQQQGQKGQGQQQGGQGQSPQGQKGGQPNPSQGGQGQQNQGQAQSGSQSGQQGSSPQGQGGQQGGQSGGGGQGQGQGEQGQSNASGALRDMANALRQGAGSGGSSNLRDMMNNLRQAEGQCNGGNASGNLTPRQGRGGTSPTEADPRQIARIGKDLIAGDPHGPVSGGAGLGPRSNAQGSNPGGGVSKVKSNRTGDKRRYEDVWSDRLPKPHSKIDRVKGKWGDAGEVEQLPTRGDGKGGQARTPYYDVYQSYKRDAEDAVGRETVPPAYKAPVKDYFESIKP